MEFFAFAGVAISNTFLMLVLVNGERKEELNMEIFAFAGVAIANIFLLLVLFNGERRLKRARQQITHLEKELSLTHDRSRPTDDLQSM